MLSKCRITQAATYIVSCMKCSSSWFKNFYVSISAVQQRRTTGIRLKRLRRFKPCPHWRLAEFGDSRRFRRQSPNSATIVASVDRALG